MFKIKKQTTHFLYLTFENKIHNNQTKKRDFSSLSKNTKNSTSLTTKINYNFFSKRSMLSGKAMHTARTFYHCLSALTHMENLNKSTKNNHEPIVTALVDLSLDNTKGTPQHKETIITAITPYRFPINGVYEYFLKKTGHEHITWDHTGWNDFRILKELPMINTFFSHFKNEIKEIECTNDSTHISLPSYKPQANPDMIVTVNSYVTGENVDKLIGIKVGYKKVCFDEKSGMNMFKHSSNGSLGFLTYDKNNENIQVMSKPISSKDLLSLDLERIRDLKKVVKTNQLQNLLKNCEEDLLKYKSKNFDIHQFFEKRNEINEYLFRNILCDSTYERSISFIFTDHPEYLPLDTSKGQAFETRFLSLLSDKMYNLDQTQDRREIFRAMLVSYKETVDPQVIQKFQHLNGINFTLSRHFLDDFAKFIKLGL